MNRFMVKIVFAFTVLFMFAGTASAEVVKGRIKAISRELQLFSLSVGQETVLIISWDNKTVWKGISDSAALKLDEMLSIDFRTGKGFPLAATVSRIKTPVPTGIKVTSLEQLAENLAGQEKGSSFTLVDSRPGELYDAGHIPGAVSLSLAKLEKRTYGLLPEKKNAKLVFYDEGVGGDSAGKAAEIATRAGYTDIAIYQEGAAGWTDSGRQLAASTAFIRKTTPVLIDIRSREQASMGHIDKAVSYPLAALKDYLDNLPVDKLTPIVIYGASDRDAATAAETVRNRGYRKVTIYPGGTVAWETNAEVLVSGPAAEEIFSKAPNHGGGLGRNDFEMALASPVMVEIVDVRSAAEHKKGGIQNSKQIPLQELAKREGELNREKIQVVFAANPVQAEMAYDYLKAKGFKLNFFSGSVEFDKNSKFTLKEK